jgi:hypothetical protein
MLSIPRTCRLEGTMLLYRCTAIGGHHCNFSMDQGERAKFEYLSATGYLPENLSASRQQWQCLEVTDVSCDVGFLEMS